LTGRRPRSDSDTNVFVGYQHIIDAGLVITTKLKSGSAADLVHRCDCCGG
jgi:hypothetical protein